MPVISRFFGISIKIQFNEHAPPHFHAEYNGDDVAIAIRNFEVLKGRPDARVLGLVMEWAALHQAELLVDWDRATSGQTPFPIAPLR